MFIWGEGTGKLRTIYGKHATDVNNLPAERLREALQELSLFPSKSQVQEMLECVGISHEASRHHVTFGEFCVLATELAQLYTFKPTLPPPRSLQPGKALLYEQRQTRIDNMPHYQVFLGGSCNPTTWRTDNAIPYLKQHGITFYNPQVTQWTPEMIELEAEAKKNADVLFFVIDTQTRATVSKIEVAYLLGQGRKMIVVLNGHHSGKRVAGETLTRVEQTDMVRSHAIITDLIERQSSPVLSSVCEALSLLPDCIQKNVSLQDISHEKNTGRVQYGHLRVGLDLVKLREAFSSIDSDQMGYLSQSDVCLAYRCVMPDRLDTKWLSGTVKPNKTSFTFDEFCCLVSERKKTLMSQSRILNFFSYIITSVKWFFGIGISHTIPSPSDIHDLYLGGSGNTDWIGQIAIPALRKNGLTYTLTRPTQSDHLLPSDAQKQDNCRVLLYVVKESTCGSAAMVQAAYNLGRGCRMVLCVQHIKGNSIVQQEKLSSRAVDDYNRGRMYLSDLANREGVSCFDDIFEAIDAAIRLASELKSATHQA